MAKPMTAEKATKKLTANAEEVVKTEGAKTAKKAEKINILRPKIRNLAVTVTGMSPLLSHNWSERQKEAMRKKHAQEATERKQKRDPEAEYLAARYVNKRGEDCILARAVKKAMVNAGGFVDAYKSHIRGAVFVLGELIPIKCKERVQREDVVRLAGQQRPADLRYRPEYREWTAAIPMQFDEGILSAEQVVNLLERAGFSIGIGDWRVECNGDFGRFGVSSVQELKAA